MAVPLRAVGTLALAGLFTISCGGVTEPSKNTVDTFSGMVSPGGSFRQSVTVNNGGEYSIKITALSPTPTAVLYVGWFQGANCDFVLSSTYAGLNQLALSGAILQKGAYSVCLSDPGILTVAQNVTVQVSHP